jgi:non-heme chloroperoxidase
MKREALARLQLELRRHMPLERGAARSVLFLHGAFGGAWCWAEHFMPYFAARGFDAYALSLRAHGESPGWLDAAGIDDYVADLEQAIETIGEAPIVVAHSLGGLVAQRYAERARLPALVLLASAPPQGVGPVLTQLAWSRPWLAAELIGLAHTGFITQRGLHEALFANPVDAVDLARWHRRTQRESLRALGEAVWPGRASPRLRADRVFVLGGADDTLVPPPLTRLCAQSLGTRAEIVPRIGHGMMLDRGWEGVAGRIVDRLARVPDEAGVGLAA